MFKLIPSLHSTIWGGNRLMSYYGDNNMDNIAESWVLSCHGDGPSIIAEGEFAGEELAKHITKADIGTNCPVSDAFPVLIKFIDARDKLSIQVHPDDEYAVAHTNEKNGKTEAWYILDTEENSELIYGFNREVTKEEFRSAIDNGTLEELCYAPKVSSGDVAFIPAKTLHGIGAGIFLIEVQQSCNVTYRAYDYKRVQSDGTLRPVHIDDSVAVSDCKPANVNFAPRGELEKCGLSEKQLLVSCEYFNMTKVFCKSEYKAVADEKSFVSLVILSGDGVVRCGDTEYSVKIGDSIFIPAGSGEFVVTGNAEILETRI